MKRTLCSIALAVVFCGVFWNGSAGARELVDRVVAVVGDQIILLSEVQRQLDAQMMERGLNYQSDSRELAALQREVVDAMVNEQLLQVKAQRDSLVPDQRNIDLFAKNEYARVRQQFPDDETFQKALDQVGMTDQQLRYMYLAMAKKTVIQQMMMQRIEQSVSVSPRELEVWYAAHADSLAEVPEQFRFSHIMMMPQVSEAKKEAAREKLRNVLTELRQGADFGALANKYSEVPGGTKDGGYIGYFKRGDFDDRFTGAAFSLKKGEVSDIVETSLGLHIIKVEDIRGDEVSARHIVALLKLDADDEAAVVQKLSEIREQIVSGKAAFPEMAKRYTEDSSTRDFGGQTKWLTRDDDNLPASFLAWGDSLKPGEVSTPFKSEYNAYHLLRLDDHRQPHRMNLADDRATLENYVKQEKIIREFGRIFADLRKETYIDIRYE